MIKFASFALLAASFAVVPAAVSAAETTQQVQATASTVAANGSVAISAGKMLYGPDARRIASVYRVAANGDAQLIIDGRMVTVPADTLSDVNGKVTTSLTKKEIVRR